MPPSPQKSTPISGLTTAVFDKGRRGNPKPGCDCVQCFGYCLSGSDAARQQSAAQAGRWSRGNRGELDFS